MRQTTEQYRPLQTTTSQKVSITSDEFIGGRNKKTTIPAKSIIHHFDKLAFAYGYKWDANSPEASAQIKMMWWEEIVVNRLDFPRDIAVGFVLDKWVSWCISDDSDLKYITLKNVVGSFGKFLHNNREWIYKQWYIENPHLKPQPPKQLAERNKVSDIELLYDAMKAKFQMDRLGFHMGIFTEATNKQVFDLKEKIFGGYLRKFNTSLILVMNNNKGNEKWESYKRQSTF